MRKRVVEQLRDQSKKIDAELRDRRERLTRTEEKMRGLADFIASSERSSYIVKTLQDHEAFAVEEREAIAELERLEHEPIRLPTAEEVEAKVIQLDDRLQADPEAGKEELRRWLGDSVIKIGPRDDGAIVAEGALLPVLILAENARSKRHLPVSTSSVVTGRYTDVAGA